MSRRATSSDRWIEKTDSCWLWRGGLGASGYGKYKGRQAHRVIYEELVGPIPDGLQLDHLCRVLICVNPAHVEPVTDLENKRRRFALQTHCKRGHEFTEANTYTGCGARQCRTCQRYAVRRYKERKLRRLSGAS